MQQLHSSPLVPPQIPYDDTLQSFRWLMFYALVLINATIQLKCKFYYLKREQPIPIINRECPSHSPTEATVSVTLTTLPEILWSFSSSSPSTKPQLLSIELYLFALQPAPDFA